MRFDEWKVSLEHNTGFHCYENTCNNQLTFYGLSSNFDAFADIYRNSVFANTGNMIYLMDTSETKIFSASEDETITLAHIDELISGNQLTLSLGCKPYDIYKNFKVRVKTSNKNTSMTVNWTKNGQPMIAGWDTVDLGMTMPPHTGTIELSVIYPNVLDGRVIDSIILFTAQTDSTKTGPADILATKNGKFY